ncbi:MAG: hypothetical protein IKR59_05505 [Lachnospiraceae bacterium]|nr:hypothetical protein [Lachnospiraceae bacterium]
MDKDLKQRFLVMLIGVALVVVGIIILLLNIEVVDFGFYRFGRVNTAVILLILLIALVVWVFIAKKKMLPLVCILVDLLLMVISVIAGTRFVFRQMNAFVVVLIIAMIGAGIGLAVVNYLAMRRGE